MSVLTPKTAGLVNLSYCVAQVQADKEDYSTHNVENYTRLAIRAYTDINLFHGERVEVVYLNMDPVTGIVDLSSISDYIDYVKIGMPINGRFWILGKNDKILPQRNELSASETALVFKPGDSTLEINNGYYFAGHYLAGNYTTGLFGLGGGFSRSYFRIDTELMQIQFDTALPRTQIVLEYRSTGINLTGGTLVPRQCVEYIVAYIHWKLAEHNPLLNRFDKRDAKENFIEEENKLRKFNFRFNINEYYQAMYSTIKQTPKM